MENENKLMLLQTQAIKQFLEANTHKDLADLYTEEMEVQVNAAQDNGQRVAGEFQGRAWNGWADPLDPTLIWKSFRIPYKAKTTPEYNPRPQKWPLGLHADGIGMTGWNWVQRTSLWVAYDFDSIANHAQGLTADELELIKTTAMSIPWVSVRKSTSGKGYHIYIFLQGVRTENHVEHAALGRAILGMLSAKTGFDFRGKVDCMGGNMWVWARKMKGTDGLTLVKKGTLLTELPPNWKDHAEVVKGSRRKNLPRYVEGTELDEFEELCGTRPRIKLDEVHLKLHEYLDDIQAQWWWDQDHWMMVCHTHDLKRAHNDLGLKGIFETMATGKEHGADHNCFAFPLRKGAWTLRRYTPGVREHASWDQDGQGYTRCFFNQEPDLKTAARALDGIENEKGGFEFTEAEVALKTARSLGADVELPSWAMNRMTILKHHKKDGRLIMEVKRESSDNGGEMRGWREDKGWWKRIFNTRVTPVTEPEVGNNDDLVRHLITDKGDDYGWVVNAGDGWQAEPLAHVKLSLKSLNFPDREINAILGNCVLRGWTLVNIPFEDEFPGDRRWNRGAAQLKYKPKLEGPFHHPTWTNVLDHTGSGLDYTVKTNIWCQANGIATGGEYLKLWVASLFQKPTEHLPYLFLFSEEENTGKSTFHQAISMLMTRGYTDGKTALTSQGSFTGELESAILCYAEELDLSQNKEARSRIKEWVTAKYISVHKKNQTPYQILNTTHWVQTANDISYCPVFPGDSRITVCYVKPLEEEIPEAELYRRLEKEASDFLGSIMSIELPIPDTRLSIPILETEDKKSTARKNMTILQMFIDEVCHSIPGALIHYGQFFDKFTNWLDADEVGNWSKIRVGRELPRNVPKGRNTADGSKFYVANISFDPKTPPDIPWRLSGDKLVR
jgi:hypothetical protein